jgi:hypothetical protein
MFSLLAPALAQAIDMRQAYELALPLALEWNPRAGLYQIHSADTGDPDPSQGVDGRRTEWYTEWYVDFTLPELVGFANTSENPRNHKVTSIGIQIAFGKVVRVSEGKNPVNWAPIPASAIPDGQKLAEAAQKAGLIPSSEFAYGFHYDLRRNGRMGPDLEGKVSLESSVWDDLDPEAILLVVHGRRPKGTLPKAIEAEPGLAGLSFLFFSPELKLLKEIN